MISAIFETIGQAITGFVSALSSALSGIADLIWVEGTSGAAGHFTVVGVLMLVALGVGVVYGAFRLIRGLTKSVA